MLCAICDTRRPRRFCPGVRGHICSLCCGTEREVTVECPLDCEYLQEARRHERPVPLDPEKFPHQEVRLTDEFIQGRHELLNALTQSVAGAAFATPGAVDYDVREAIEGLIQTYKTLQSGVYYESRPGNPLAARIFGAVQESLARYRDEEQQRHGVNQIRDGDILRALVYLGRVELHQNNGRRRGRAFMGMLRQFYSAAAPETRPSSSLIIP